MNFIALSGRLTAAPEIRTTDSGKKVASFSIAVDRPFTGNEAQADFFEIVAWEKKAEFAEKYLGKGRKVIVTGRLQTRSWKAKDGSNRKTTEVIADQLEFADSKPNGTNPVNVEPPEANFDVIDPSDELPF